MPTIPTGVQYDEISAQIEKMIPAHVPYIISDDEREDVIQECRIAAWKAIERFDPSKGKIDHFLNVTLANAVRMHARSFNRRVKALNTFSLTDIEEDTHAAPVSTTPHTSPEEIAVHEFYDLLPAPLQAVTRAVMTSQSQRDIEEQLHLTPTPYKNRRQQLRDLYQHYYSEDSSRQAAAILSAVANHPKAVPHTRYRLQLPRSTVYEIVRRVCGDDELTYRACGRLLYYFNILFWKNLLICNGTAATSQMSFPAIGINRSVGATMTGAKQQGVSPTMSNTRPGAWSELRAQLAAHRLELCRLVKPAPNAEQTQHVNYRARVQELIDSIHTTEEALTAGKAVFAPTLVELDAEMSALKKTQGAIPAMCAHTSPAYQDRECAIDQMRVNVQSEISDLRKAIDKAKNAPPPPPDSLPALVLEMSGLPARIAAARAKGDAAELVQLEARLSLLPDYMQGKKAQLAKLQRAVADAEEAATSTRRTTEQLQQDHARAKAAAADAKKREEDAYNAWWQSTTSLEAQRRELAQHRIAIAALTGEEVTKSQRLAAR